MKKTLSMSELGPPPGKSSPLSEREAYWAEHVRRWRASGLSQGAYSRREGLRANQLSYWQRREQRQRQASSSSATSKFVPVEVKRSSLSPVTASLSGSGLTVRLANGARLEGIDAHSVELAAQLLKAL